MSIFDFDTYEEYVESEMQGGSHIDEILRKYEWISEKETQE